MDKSWKLKETDENIISDLESGSNISPIMARVLANRGLETPRQVEEFLDFSLESLNDPFLLKGMEESVSRIMEAIKEGQKILIYGDYDVDGISSTSLLIKLLEEMDAEVDFYIPNRLEEGYGMNEEAIKEIAKGEISLIITVDCGISAKGEVQLANSLGIEVIITDHHTPPEELPGALAIINPKQEGCNYPFKELAGVGVAFKLAHALLNSFYGDDDRSRLLKYMGIVALGTVADIVPLVGENRLIVKYGLDRINAGYSDFNINILKDKIGYKDKDITAGQVGYYLTPCINAAGRLGKAQLGVQLFTTDSSLEAGELSSKLREMNSRRQEITEDIILASEQYIAENIDLEREWVLVVTLEGGHSGVIGNAASKIQEKYHRPVLLISSSEDGKAVGSARSINRFNLYEAFKYCEEYFDDFGGHKEAAGCSLKKEDIPKLRKKINQYAHNVLEEGDLRARVYIDVAIEPEDASFNLISELEVLEPFGFGNPRPKFLLEGLKLKDFKTFGREGDHLKFRFLKEGGYLEGIAWGRADLTPALAKYNKEIRVVANLGINSFGGRDKVDLTIKDIKLTPSDFNARVIDNRNIDNKIDYIKGLIEKKESIIIYTNSSKVSIELSNILKEDLSDQKIFIASYNNRVSKEGRKRLREEFIRGEKKVLVTTNIILGEAPSLFVEDMIFYNLNFSSKEFVKTFNLTKGAKETSLHLIYGNKDEVENIRALNNRVPNRDTLAQIYIGLKRLPKADLLNLDKDLIAGLINSSSNLKVTGETILSGCQILKELNLLTVDKGEEGGIKISLLAKPDYKLDLKESTSYNLGIEEKDRFNNFKDIGLYGKVDRLIKLIN